MRGAGNGESSLARIMRPMRIRLRRWRRERSKAPSSEAQRFVAGPSGQGGGADVGGPIASQQQDQRYWYGPYLSFYGDPLRNICPHNNTAEAVAQGDCIECRQEALHREMDRCRCRCGRTGCVSRIDEVPVLLTQRPEDRLTSREAAQDDHFGILRRTARSLAEVYRESMEVEAAQMWNDRATSSPSPGPYA